MRWTPVPWTIVIATISAAQTQPDPTTGTGRPIPGPSRPDTVVVDSTGAAARRATTNRAALTGATTIVTLHVSEGVAFVTTRRTDGSGAGTVRPVRVDDVWRVRAWHGAVSGEPDATASVCADARPGHRDAPVPTRTSSEAATTTRLAIRALADRSGGALAFEVALPAAGGTLELFDVAGRRVARRELDGIAPGARRVSLEARGLAPGVYVARVRQRDAAATAHVAWYR